MTKYKPHTPYVGVGIIGLNKKNEILVIRRAHKLAGGYHTWAIPGGGVNYGEHFLDSAKREFKEETGLCLIEPKIFCITNDNAGQFHWITITVIGRVKDEKVILQEDEVDAYKWVKPTNIPKPWYKIFNTLVSTPEWQQFRKKPRANSLTL